MAFNPDAELDLIELYYATENTKYLAVSLFVVLVCETLATIPLEAKYVWNSRWSFGRIMFHANRTWAPIMLAIYIPSMWALTPRILSSAILNRNLGLIGLFMYNLSEKMCLAYWLFYIYGSIVTQVIVASVLIARIWAIYQTNIWILAALCLCCAILSTPSIVLLQMQASAAHLIKNPAPKLISGCPTTINPLAFVPYLPPFVAETMLFILTIYKPLKISREVSTPLMSRLILHGTQYYIVVFITLTFIVVGSLFPSTNHIVNGSGLIVVVWSIVCSRLILSGRSWYDKSHDSYSGLEMSTLPRLNPPDEGSSWAICKEEGRSRDLDL